MPQITQFVCDLSWDLKYLSPASMKLNTPFHIAPHSIRHRGAPSSSSHPAFSPSVGSSVPFTGITGCKEEGTESVVLTLGLDSAPLFQTTPPGPWWEILVLMRIHPGGSGKGPSCWGWSVHFGFSKATSPLMAELRQASNSLRLTY